MGWTGIHADDLSQKGRKAEIEALFSSDDYEILKGVMTGSTYYGAVRHDGHIFALVALTSADSREWCNFRYKLMTEDEGPCCFGCPESVLSLLPPAGSEYAADWRNECHRQNSIRRKRRALSRADIGDTVNFRSPFRCRTFQGDILYGKGDLVTAKRRLIGEKKMWICDKGFRWKNADIPDEFVITKNKS